MRVAARNCFVALMTHETIRKHQIKECSKNIEELQESRIPKIYEKSHFHNHFIRNHKFIDATKEGNENIFKQEKFSKPIL